MSTKTASEPVAKANDRHDLYRWMQDGVEWACCAYDHGPMCRRCRPVGDKVDLLDNVESGWLLMWDDDLDGWRFENF